VGIRGEGVSLELSNCMEQTPAQHQRNMLITLYYTSSTRITCEYWHTGTGIKRTTRIPKIPEIPAGIFARAYKPAEIYGRTSV
jgi:hypothetical protein